MRILIVEDDRKIASFIAKGLKESGYAVDQAHDGGQGLSLALSQSYDAAVMDIMLPGIDGIEIIEEMRRQKIDTPVLILSAKRSLDDRINGLQKGGDDYLTKPFAFSELLARLQALIRRSSRTVEPGALKVGDLSMDLLQRTVKRSGEEISLQPKEFSLLEYLMRNTDKVVSKTTILEHVWDYSFDPQTNVVDVVICRLRNKVDKGYDTKLIHTIRGVGYVCKTP
ncbi:response regulator [Dethiosulfatarculus sandiegensis]|uniref:XRE family transcriptional regulator n=1 Tax=Dethiosulfatarculus sandiegensis TaxID=1429043 RepID=A0A0D2HJW1_9BACT|nr:response regulator transcription factor [Dethiosulfatarculus sandiegensis]KIX10943.1 XRE family transcriptional regulator [Dethiosulfatarculus sandiegensis]